MGSVACRRVALEAGETEESANTPHGRTFSEFLRVAAHRDISRHAPRKTLKSLVRELVLECLKDQIPVRVRGSQDKKTVAPVLRRQKNDTRLALDMGMDRADGRLSVHRMLAGEAR